MSLNELGGLNLNNFLILSAMMFFIGTLGVLLRKNIIVILMSIEVMLNAVNIAFIAFSRYSLNTDGQVMVFFVMTIAAAEAAGGMALAVMIYKKFKEINIEHFSQLKG